MAWHKVAKADDLGPGEVMEVRVGETPIALYNLEGEYLATHNICTHAQANLHEGYLDGDTIECPLHQQIFDVRTGEAVEGPAEEDLQTFPVKREGDDILVEV